MAAGRIPKAKPVDREAVRRRSAQVKAALAMRTADRHHREAEERGDRIAKTAATLRDIRERNHLGEMVSDALKAGDSVRQ